MEDYGLVSIICPMYNVSRFINRTIDCVLAQTYQNFEILVVDDCSSDESREIINSIGDERIHLFLCPSHEGAAAARNLAISKAKGDFVAFLDAEVQTADLARKYEIIPTPTLIFLSANGKELFVYPGFMPQQKFQKALDFFKNPDLESMESQAIKQSFQNFLES